MKQMWSGNDNHTVESPLARLESLPRDPLYMVVMKTKPKDVFNLSNTNKRFKDLFCGKDERAKGFRANYVTLHFYTYDWKNLSEDVLLMWIDSLIENTDWATADNNNAIQLAVENDHLEVVRLLLDTPDRGIDPAADDNYPIILAARCGHVEMVRLLLDTPDRGIDPAVSNNFAIRFAAANGNVEVVRLLLNTPNRGIDPAAVDNHIIRFAAYNGHVELVRLLLNTPNRGIDPAADNNYAILYAAKKGHLEIVQLLLESGRVDPGGIQSNSEEINDLICNYTK